MDRSWRGRGLGLIVIARREDDGFWLRLFLIRYGTARTSYGDPSLGVILLKASTCWIHGLLQRYFVWILDVEDSL